MRHTTPTNPQGLTWKEVRRRKWRKRAEVAATALLILAAELLIAWGIAVEF